MLDLLLSTTRRLVGLYLPDPARTVLLSVVVGLTELLLISPGLTEGREAQNRSVDHTSDD